MLHPQPVPVPQPGHRHTRLLRAAVGVPVKLACVSRQLVGFDVHYEGRSFLCTNVLGSECPYCRRQWPRQWKGFLLGYQAGTTYRAILEVPAECARITLAFQAGQPPLTGAAVTLTRTGPHRNSECVAQVQHGAYTRVVERSTGDLWALLSAIFDGQPTPPRDPGPSPRPSSDVGDVPC